MLSLLLTDFNMGIIQFAGLAVSFLAVVFLLSALKEKLPRDQGRAFAHDGAKSAGKPRGAGIVFVLVFVFSFFLFGRFRTEYMIYLLLVTASMMTGYLDDAAKHPWGEYKKGFLDLLIAILTAFTYIHYNGCDIYFRMFDRTVTLPAFVFGLLIVILVWTSINVTNCADGVDGLSGTLSIITLGTFYFLIQLQGGEREFSYGILLFIVSLTAYLWYNATPSVLLMGDAGSRAMGMVIAIAVLKTDNPFIYIPAAIVLILDGGLGLVKVALLRFLKIKFLMNVRLPLHDHARKNKGWSNTQCVFRFAIIQAMISLAVIYGYFI